MKPEFERLRVESFYKEKNQPENSKEYVFLANQVMLSHIGSVSRIQR